MGAEHCAHLYFGAFFTAGYLIFLLLTLAMFYDIVKSYVPLNQTKIEGSVKGLLPHFLEGYTSENRLDPKWLKEIPLFLKIREIDPYAVIHRSFDVNNIDNPWVAGFMKGRRERIERDVPFLDFDFSTCSELLTSPLPASQA